MYTHKKLKSVLAGSIGVLALAFSTVPADACSAFILAAKDKGVVIGRTMEFGSELHSNILIIPKGTKMRGLFDNPNAGMEFTTKYSILGANALGVNMIADGFNDQGLYVGDLYFPGFYHAPELSKENEKTALGSEDYGTWLLANFATVDEVKKHFKDVTIVQHKIEGLGNISFPAHYIVTDRSGKSIVIEPTKDGVKLYENPLGVLTNSPGFEWHMTNLRNYLNVMPNNIESRKIAGVEFGQLGGGTGFQGLPGDFTPPSRFLRLVAFSKSSPQPEDTQDAVFKVSHIMNMFDIPYGAIKLNHGDHISFDYTQWSSVVDLKNLVYYYKTFKNNNLVAVDMKKALEAAKGKERTIKMEIPQVIPDNSTNFIK